MTLSCTLGNVNDYFWSPNQRGTNNSTTWYIKSLAAIALIISCDITTFQRQAQMIRNQLWWRVWSICCHSPGLSISGSSWRMSRGGAKRSDVDRNDDAPFFHSALPWWWNACLFLPHAVAQTSQLQTSCVCKPDIQIVNVSRRMLILTAYRSKCFAS